MHRSDSNKWTNGANFFLGTTNKIRIKIKTRWQQRWHGSYYIKFHDNKFYWYFWICYLSIGEVLRKWATVWVSESSHVRYQQWIQMNVSIDNFDGFDGKWIEINANANTKYSHYLFISKLVHQEWQVIVDSSWWYPACRQE